jgi:ATP-dependent protease ClpP protease subunit
MLLVACRTLVSEVDPDTKTPKWDTIHLTLTCGGGAINAAFAAYNELRGLPVKLITHNVGATDSAALLFFMAGSQRLASAASAFHFHQVAWSFSSKDDLPVTVLGDALRWLTE